MKEIQELHLPEELKYTQDHEWVRGTETVRIGITDFAQDQLGDIVFVELPEVGTQFEAGDVFSTVESVKAVSEVYTPVSGEVVAVNEPLEENPELVNQDPYGQGWIMDIKTSDSSELEGLMDRSAYMEMLKGEE
ncbi:MAG: glycine cleavage system protein GcvH [Desulfohalobiaceae bacterium]|nr:glycine cleavage system protein GcvH [Desulfohalobiaceae bacterium]